MDDVGFNKANFLSTIGKLDEYTGVMQMTNAKPAAERVNVVPAAQVHDQRIVALMWARAAMLGGFSALAGGLWPPVNWEITLNGLVLSAIGLGLLWALSNLGNRRVAVGLAIGLGLAGLYIGWNASQRLLPGYVIPPLFTMKADFLAALAEMNRQGGSGSWYVARLIGSVAGMVVAVETVLLAWYLFCNPANVHATFSPLRTGTGSRLVDVALGAPRGLWPYVKSAKFSMVLLVISLILFTVAGVNVVAGMWFQSFQAQADITGCVGLAATELGVCIAQKGAFAKLGMTLQYLFAVMVFPLIAWLLSLWGEHVAAKNAADRLGSDKRNPLIFLRSFDDDQVTLKSWPRTILQLLMSPHWWRLNMDRMLLSEFMSWAPPKALGKPEEKTRARPFGALRKFAEFDPPGTPEDKSHWRIDVRKYAADARLIVMAFDEKIMQGDKGVSWEMQHISKNPVILQKTIFLISPKGAVRRQDETEEAHAERMNALWRRAGEMSGFEVTQDMTSALACFPSQKLVFCGERFSASEYLMALRASIHAFDPES